MWLLSNLPGLLRSLTAVALALSCIPANAHERDPEWTPDYLQVYLGAMDVTDNEVAIDTGDDKGVADEFPEDLPWAGGVTQMPRYPGRFQYGLESGGFISWKDTDTNFLFFNNTALVSVDTSLLLIELFLGGFVSYKVNDLVRLHAGAGPLALYSRLDLEGDEEEEDPESTRVIIVSGGTRIVLADEDSDSDLALGGYVRIGIDLHWDHDSAIGISARYIDAQPDFDDSFGEVSVRGPQLFLTFTRLY